MFVQSKLVCTGVKQRSDDSTIPVKVLTLTLKNKDVWHRNTFPTQFDCS
jgi:hypothetical protein